MNQQPRCYQGYRFPPDVISHAVWLYHRFTLSLRDIEDLLAESGILVSHASIRRWCMTFGLNYARAVRKRQNRLGDIWHLDEAVLVMIGGRGQYLWRAVDRVEVSHEHTRAQERQMRRFKSPGQAQRFLSVHSQVRNLFRVGRHLLRAANYRTLRGRAVRSWQGVTCVC